LIPNENNITIPLIVKKKSSKQDTHLVVLAAGKGKRMKSDLPKVLLPVNKKPMLNHLLDTVEKVGLADRTIIVTGTGSDKVRETAGPKYKFAHQESQHGTGHAVRSAEPLLRDKARHVMVLYGDHPLVDADTIEKLIDKHTDSEAILTMGTVKVPHFGDWREAFRDYGRVQRDTLGNITRIIEKKDATLQELGIMEFNPSYFIFNALWLWDALSRLKNNNSQGEYYLTDLAGLAQEDGVAIADVSIDPLTALGANTPEQLALLEKIMRERK
jgi:bifunctional UDP-N-acetylglucosamine pyrophosphorylase/glucosamine-1-phosphate N-acetyltransferase